MRYRVIAAGLGSVFALACGAAPAAPERAAVVPIALAGQSNADFIRPYLTAAAAPAAVVGFAQDGSTIRQWAIEAPEGYWSRLVPALHQPLRAFVFWLGESNRDNVAEYAAMLPELFARVRREANDPRLLVVVCRVVDDPAFVGVRAAQAAYVAGDPESVLVSSDGVPREAPGSAHLSPAGYVEMSSRILAAIGGRR